MMNAIEIKNLRKSLGNFSLKIDDLKVPEGFVTGFIGPNGSGKTTTIKLIMNMINKDQGTIKMWGKDYKINDLTIKEISAMLGLHRDVYSRYEKGLRDFPIDILIKLADIYHCSIDYLVGRVDTK